MFWFCHADNTIPAWGGFTNLVAQTGDILLYCVDLLPPVHLGERGAETRAKRTPTS